MPTFQEERDQVVRYLRMQLIDFPADEAEEHVNYVIESLAADIKQGKHARSKH